MCEQERRARGVDGPSCVWAMNSLGIKTLLTLSALLDGSGTLGPFSQHAPSLGTHENELQSATEKVVPINDFTLYVQARVLHISPNDLPVSAIEYAATASTERPTQTDDRGPKREPHKKR